jgi:hypothetical protein
MFLQTQDITSAGELRRSVVIRQASYDVPFVTHAGGCDDPLPREG